MDPDLITEVETPDDTPRSFDAPESSSVIRADYDPDCETLIVEFVGGKRYGYGNISPGTWREFVQAESKGAYFNKHIRPMAGGKQL
jgi:hypothetical protein